MKKRLRVCMVPEGSYGTGPAKNVEGELLAIQVQRWPVESGRSGSDEWSGHIEYRVDAPDLEPDARDDLDGDNTESGRTASEAMRYTVALLLEHLDARIDVLVQERNRWRAFAKRLRSDPGRNGRN